MRKRKSTLQHPPQKQAKQPGIESKMKPEPEFEDPHYIGSEKLKNKVAIITGGDRGIGRVTAIYFAIEGADICFTYLNEAKDAKKTKAIIEEKGRQCIMKAGDLGNPRFCKNETGCGTQRNRALLCIFGIGRFFLYVRASITS